MSLWHESRLKQVINMHLNRIDLKTTAKFRGAVIRE